MVQVMDKVSRISLVDLAGSERAQSTGAEVHPAPRPLPAPTHNQPPESGGRA